MAVRKPRVGEESRRWREMVLVVWRWASSSGSWRLLALVRSIVGGRLVERLRSVSVSHAMRSKTQRTDPARELITSRTSSVIFCKYDLRPTNLDLRVVMSCHCSDRLVGQ